jgi:8-oxo-dGTP diphosphatase
MEITGFGLSEVDHDRIQYVVLLTEYRHEWVIIRHKHRDVWEMPGGKREQGEQLLHAACRELYEETGAVSAQLTPYGVYLMNGSYGMNFHARIDELGELPDYEIAEIAFCKSLPAGLSYGDIYYRMYKEWMELNNKISIETYSVRYGRTSE